MLSLSLSHSLRLIRYITGPEWRESHAVFATIVAVDQLVSSETELARGEMPQFQ